MVAHKQTMKLDELTPLLRKKDLDSPNPTMEMVKETSVKRIHKAATTMKIMDSLSPGKGKSGGGMGPAYIGEYAKTFNASDRAKSVISKSKL